MGDELSRASFMQDLDSFEDDGDGLTVHSVEDDEDGLLSGTSSERVEDNSNRLQSSGSSYNMLDFEESSTISMLESIERQTENLLSDRMLARADHLEKVRGSVDAKHVLLVATLENSFNTEWSLQETSPLYASQLVAHSINRSRSLLASKQALENFNIPTNLISRISDAVDNEMQIVQSTTEAARKAGEQQKQLRDLEVKAYLADLALLEKHHNERMELLKTAQEEREQHLNVWAISRADTLETLSNMEENTQNLQEVLDILKETTKQIVSKLEKERLHARVGDSSQSPSECGICTAYIEDPSSERPGFSLETDELKKRSCLIPCNHAMLCLDCATKLWESSKLCPFCNTTLTSKPLALFM